MTQTEPGPHHRAWLFALALLLTAVSTNALGQPVKIMPFGDSWTHGYGNHVSYRYDLWFLLAEAGFDVDFVGGNNETVEGPDLDLYPLYLTEFDRDHQGSSGYRTDMLAVFAKSVAAKHLPDIVLLWAGGNDVCQMGLNGANNAKTGLRDTINGIRSSVPGVIILLATATYFDCHAEAIPNLNLAITSVANDMDTSESPVILVEQHTGFDPATMLQSDRIHHNRTGEAWVAANWFEVLADILPLEQRFEINAGHAGAWYNSATSGQGQLIDVVPEDQFLFLAWFTFTDAASSNPFEQHWYTAQGNYSGNKANLILHETLGGRFDHAQEPSTNPIGTVTLIFSDCTQGEMAYRIDSDGLEGSFPLERLIPGSENICEGQSGRAATEAIDINPGMDGTWVNDDTLGQGFLIDAHPNPNGSNFIFVAWFTYGDDTASGQRWLTAQGDFSGSTAAIDVYETTGGSFDDPQAVSVGKVGTMTIDFTDCSNAQLSYSLTEDGVAGDMTISRLIPGGQALCEELALAD